MRARVCGACARGRVRRGMTVLTRLACKNRDDLVVRLLTSYCEPDERGNALKPDLYGNTCLHYFAARANDGRRGLLGGACVGRGGDAAQQCEPDGARGARVGTADVRQRGR